MTRSTEHGFYFKRQLWTTFVSTNTRPATLRHRSTIALKDRLDSSKGNTFPDVFYILHCYSTRLLFWPPNDHVYVTSFKLKVIGTWLNPKAEVDCASSSRCLQPTSPVNWSLFTIVHHIIAGLTFNSLLHLCKLQRCASVWVKEQACLHIDDRYSMWSLCATGLRLAANGFACNKEQRAQCWRSALIQVLTGLNRNTFASTHAFNSRQFKSSTLRSDC